MAAAIQPQFATKILPLANLKGKVVVPVGLAQSVPPAPIGGKESIR